MATATIVHEGGSEVVEGFTYIEEVSAIDEAHPDIRVWYSEPGNFEDAQYNLYGNATITEVEP